MTHEPRRGCTAEPLAVFDLGIAPYKPVQDLQTRLRAAVADEVIPGVLLLLEHEPVITLGRRGAVADLCDAERIQARGIDVVPSERGGQVTLHAPGQLVAYPIVPIPQRNLGAYVRDLEETLLVLLAGLGVSGHRRESRPGLYVKGDKIASVGLRCQRWVASHGTALNVNVDLSLFDLIVSCGEPRLQQTSLQAVAGRACDMDRIKALYIQAARQVFGWELRPLRTLSHQQVEAEVPTAGFEPATPGSGGQCSIP
jgi:lipoate-protein ligase B